MASRPVTLAIQSSDGQKRVSLSGTSKTDELFTKVKDAFSLKSSQFSLYKKQNKTFEIANSRTKSVTQEGLNHGDRLFMFPKNKDQNLFENSNSSSNNESKVPKVVIEDELDQELDKLDGKIYQNHLTFIYCEALIYSLGQKIPYCQNYIIYCVSPFVKCQIDRMIRCISMKMQSESFLLISNFKNQPVR